MNYLAHAWLARHSDDAILGALLGDFVFGQSNLPEWPPAIRAEIVRHRRIDQYTDAHPAVAAARGLFDNAGLRRYAGIVLDVAILGAVAWAARTRRASRSMGA